MTAPTDLVIVGAGGHGRQLHDLVDAHNAAGHPPYRVLGFLDDGPVDDDLLARRGTRHLGLTSALADTDAAFVIGIAHPADRRRIAEAARLRGQDAESLRHPAAVVGSLVTWGPGLFLSAGAVLDTNVTLGAHVHLNYGVSIGHESRVGDHVTITPGARISGNVVIGDDVFIGANSAVTPGITIGDGAVIGAGAVVRRDVAPRATYTGLLDARSPRAKPRP